MNAVQASSPKTLRDPARMNTNTEELAGRDHAMLIR
jgi:hypothetical protein